MTYTMVAMIGQEAYELTISKLVLVILSLQISAVTHSDSHNAI